MKRYFIFIVCTMYMFLCGCEDMKVEKNNDKTTLPQEAVSTENELSDIEIYNDDVQSFRKVTVPEVIELQNKNERFYLYVGRATCPHCCLFVEKLNEIVQQEKNVEIYYLDSQNTELDDELKTFRENHKIDYVPSFSLFEGDNIKKGLYIDDTITKKDISDFMKYNPL